MASVGRLGGCAVKTDSSLLCWGGLLAPEVVALGDAGFVSAGEGGMVSVADQFTAVAVGRTHACGIATHFGVRDVQCWGENKQGQVGFEGASPVTHPYMVGINAYGNVTEIAVGGDQSCARVDTGSVYCWGAEYVRQTDASASVGLRKVSLLGGAMEIAVGDFHACAVMNDRTVECWGDNSVAQLGGGHAGAAQGPSVVVRRTLAGQLTPLLTVDHIAAGGRTTCAKLVTDTRIHCWGANDYGQAGQPASSAPVAYASVISW
jgi:alpha-tubulin suppressor-like RCC1 family protein